MIVWLDYAAWLHVSLSRRASRAFLGGWAVLGLAVTAFAFIGVNLLRDRSVRYDFDEVPSSGRLLRDKLRGRSHPLPGLTALLLNTSMMHSHSRQHAAQRLVDLYFSPDVHRFGMLEWSQFDRIVQAGYDHAREVIDRDGLDALRARPFVPAASPADPGLSPLGSGLPPV